MQLVKLKWKQGELWLIWAWHNIINILVYGILYIFWLKTEEKKIADTPTTKF